MSKRMPLQVEVSFDDLEELLDGLQTDSTDHSDEVLRFIKKATDLLDIEQCLDLYSFLGKILEQDFLLLEERKQSREQKKS